MSEKRFPCKQCGAALEFQPDTAVQKCPYCGFENPIPQSPEEIKELDFKAHLAALSEQEETHEKRIVKCSACGAEVSFSPEMASDRCPFCGVPIVTTGGSTKAIKPKSLLPFKVERDQATGFFKCWLKGLWFAPNDLKAYADTEERLQGLYVPYWTYDCDTTTAYQGERGDDYWETESYTAIENGKSVRRTRQVRKTRWTHVRGVVWNEFDDLLVLASRSLPRVHAEALAPWDLPDLVPYCDEYLSGFRAESYQVDLTEGFVRARELADPTIEATVRQDIGGDHQRIQQRRTRYDNITFKHLLLPIWLSAYIYRDKTYRFLVNGRTGKVQGERPYSWIKITLFVLVVAGAIGWLIYQFNHLPT